MYGCACILEVPYSTKPAYSAPAVTSADVFVIGPDCILLRRLPVLTGTDDLAPLITALTAALPPSNGALAMLAFSFLSNASAFVVSTTTLYGICDLLTTYLPAYLILLFDSDFCLSFSASIRSLSY